MELTQLRYFYQVYQAGSIRSASGDLNVTQQAISRQIQNLEEELGVKLFLRSKNGVESTEYGHMLAEKAALVLPELDQVMYAMQKHKSVVSGVVKLGVQCWQMTWGNNLRYEVLEDFRKLYPQIRLVYENLSPTECCQRVLDGSLDLAVSVMPGQIDGLELTPLRDFQWYFLMAGNHPLADRRCLRIEDLENQRLIIAGEEADCQNQIKMALVGKGMPLFIDVKDFIFDLLGQEILGNHAMMLTATAQLGFFNQELFAMVPLKEGFLRSRMYMCHPKGRFLTPAAEALYRFLLDNWTNL